MEMFAQTDDAVLEDWTDMSLDQPEDDVPLPIPVYTTDSLTPNSFSFSGNTKTAIMARSLFRPHQVLISFTGAVGATIRVETAINYEGYPRAALTGLATMKALTSRAPPSQVISKVNIENLTGIKQPTSSEMIARSYKDTPVG